MNFLAQDLFNKDREIVWHVFCFRSMDEGRRLSQSLLHQSRSSLSFVGEEGGPREVARTEPRAPMARPPMSTLRAASKIGSTQRLALNQARNPAAVSLVG